jgi:hypothetical protein
MSGRGREMDGEFDFGKLGPAMKALPNDRWRAACIAFVTGPSASHGHKGYIEAVIAAGFEGARESLRVQAHRMFHDYRMQAAVIEEARKTMVGMVPVARAAVQEISQTPGDPQRLAAAKTILDRAGVHEVREERITQEVTVSVEFQQRAVLMAQRMGLPIEKLLGHRLAQKIPATVDAEFVEVKPRTLEDIL